MPTGPDPAESPIIASAIEAKRLPDSVNTPNNCNRVGEGSLKGRGIKDLRKSSPYASTSTHSPGETVMSPPSILAPLALKPPLRFAKAAESNSALKAPVLAC